MSYAFHPPSALGRRAALRAQGHRGPSLPEATPDVHVAHGVCGCGRRTFLHLPGRLCEKCVKDALTLAWSAAIKEMEGVE